MHGLTTPFVNVSAATLMVLHGRIRAHDNPVSRRYNDATAYRRVTTVAALCYAYVYHLPRVRCHVAIRTYSASSAVCHEYSISSTMCLICIYTAASGSRWDAATVNVGEQLMLRVGVDFAIEITSPTALWAYRGRGVHVVSSATLFPHSGATPSSGVDIDLP